MTNKKATTSQPILAPIANRWSPRAFIDKAIEPEKLQQIFEAARWSASAFNEQPWRFVVGTKDNLENYEKVLACLGEFNQVWAKSAPVLLIVVASKQFARNDKPNGHALYDTGQAMAALAIQAQALELYVHQMAGFSAEKAAETFNIPDDFQPVVAAALGYLGDPAQLSDRLREREVMPRERRPLAETIFSGTWGQTSTIGRK